jgi:hypothetical protein
VSYFCSWPIDTSGDGDRLYRGARYGTLGGGTTETLRDLIGKRIMDATETGAELLAYDMMNGA